MATKPKGSENKATKLPPKAGRFPKGKSGNPKGRPKGTPNMGTVIEKALKQPVTITDKGRTRKITKKEAIAMQLVNKAAQGEPRAMQHALTALRYYEERSAAPAPAASWAFTEDDEKVIAQVVERILLSAPKESP
jgi:hypothetical protein